MHRGARVAPVMAVLTFATALSACGSSGTASPPSGSSTTSSTDAAGPTDAAQVSSLTSLSANASAATFAATYTYNNGTRTETVTFAQAPPSYLFKTSAGGLGIDTGSATYYCSASGHCITAGTTSPIAPELGLFDGSAFQSAMNAYAVAAPVLAALHVTLRFSSAIYAGQSSTCVTATPTQSSAGKTPVKWCVSTTGLLTYWSAGTSSFTLATFSSSPPSSDFVVPAGDTVVTVP